MNRVDIKAEVIDYIRNSGESIKDYNIGAIVDNLLVRYRLEGIESYRDYFEVAVYSERHSGCDAFANEHNRMLMGWA